MTGMDVLKYVGGCLPVFLIAVAFDVVGIIVLFVGIFANLRLDGQFYGDFLIYTGAIVIFLSAFFWLMWYVGNIHVSEHYRDPYDQNSMVERLARTLSRKMSQKPATVKRVKSAESANGVQVGPTPPHKASRVTWGKTSAFTNKGFFGDDGYEDDDGESVDSPSLQRKLEREQGVKEVPPSRVSDEPDPNM